MSFKVVVNLSAKEKQRKTEEAIKWLQEQGQWPDTETIHKTLLEAQHLLNELQYELDKAGHNNTVLSKLAANAQEQLNTIKI